jgi:hypothetical protein
MQNRRAHVRYDFSEKIEYVLQDFTNEIFKAVTINISDSGLGLYVFKPLNSGQVVRIKGIPGSLNTGTVRWCKELGDNVYRVGVMFTR